MKLWKAPCLLALLALFLSACSSTGLQRLALVTEGRHIIDENMPGDLIILGGSVTLPPGAALQGSLYLLRGEAVLAGQVRGDVSQLAGRLLLQPGARVDGSLQTAGGELLRSPGSEIVGSVEDGAEILFSQGVPSSPGTSLDRLVKVLLDSLLLGLAAAALAHFFPAPLQRIAESAAHHPAASAAMGFLVAVVGVSLLVTMAYTILLIPVALLGLLVLGAAVAIGWIAWGTILGKWVFGLFKRSLGAGWAAFTGTLLFGLGQASLSWIPTLGPILSLLIALTGFGAVFLTRFGLQAFNPPAIQGSLN
jgi:hypothetical protein